MKSLKKTAICIIILTSLFLILQCDNLVEEVTKQNVVISTPILNGAIDGPNNNPNPILLTEEQTFKSSAAKLGKAMVDDFIEVPVSLPDIGQFLQILQSGVNVNFACQLYNRGNYTVVFGIYFSDARGLQDPWTQATMIGTLTLPGTPEGGTPPLVEVNKPSDFDVGVNVTANMLSYLASADTEAPVIVYLTVKTLASDGNDAIIDVLVRNMQLILPSFVHIKNVVTPNDFSNYEDKVLEITVNEISGSFTNNGPNAVSFNAYLSIVPVDDDNPPDADRFAHGDIAVSETIHFNDVSKTHLDLSPLNRGLAALSPEGGSNTLHFNIFFVSPTAIVATADSLELESNVKVDLAG